MNSRHYRAAADHFATSRKKRFVLCRTRPKFFPDKAPKVETFVTKTDKLGHSQFLNGPAKEMERADMSWRLLCWAAVLSIVFSCSVSQAEKAPRRNVQDVWKDEYKELAGQITDLQGAERSVSGTDDNDFFGSGSQAAVHI